MIKTIIFVLLSYLIGAFPTGYILVKLFKKQDIRDYGSRNIGFSNVLRSFGLLLGSVVLLIDIGKAFLVTYYFPPLFPMESLYRLILGVCALLGNIFTPFLGFKGGKGVATGLGVALAISPLSILCALLGFVITVALTRYISLGSLVGVVVYIFCTLVFYPPSKNNMYPFIFSLLLFIMVSVRHSTNIKRLIQGKESKIGQRKKSN